MLEQELDNIFIIYTILTSKVIPLIILANYLKIDNGGIALEAESSCV